MLRKKAKGDYVLRLMPVGISGMKFEPPTITTWRTWPPIIIVPTSTFMHSYVSEDNKREPRRSGQFITTCILDCRQTRQHVINAFWNHSRGRGDQADNRQLTNGDRTPARSNWLVIQSLSLLLTVPIYFFWSSGITSD